MKAKLIILLFFLGCVNSYTVISSFTDFENASIASIKGSLQEDNSFEEIVDMSLCLRFLLFFKQKTTLGYLQI